MMFSKLQTMINKFKTLSVIIIFMLLFSFIYTDNVLSENTIMDNKLYELTLKRRSVRRYTGKAIDDKIIKEIMKVALTAPSSFGHRPVEFVVVQDKTMIEKLASCKRLGGSQIIGAGAVIAVVINQDNGEFWIEDGAIASSYILLAAEQYNVGACWVHIRNRKGKIKSSDEEIRDLLNIPDNYRVLNLIALGEKAENKRSYKETDFDTNKIHYNYF